MLGLVIEMIILGLDLSITETGYCVYHLEKKNIVEKGTIKSDKKNFDDEDGLDRFIFIKNTIELLIKKHSVDTVCMEGFSFGSKGQAIFQIAGMSYMVRYALFTFGMDYMVVPPTVLKKFVCGKGNVKKELMILNAYKKWKISFDNNNECDAFALVKYYEDSIKGGIK